MRSIRWLTMPGPMSLLRSVEVVVVEEPQRLYRVSRPREDERFTEAFRSHYEQGLPPRGPEDRAAVIHMALSMFASADVAAQLASRVPKLGGHIATIDLVPGLGLCVAKTGGPAHWSVWGRPLQLAELRDRCCESQQLTSTLGVAAMTYSIFDSTGNLVDAFNDRAAALDCLAGIAQAEPQSASEVFLIAQDDDGNTVGQTVYASSVSVPA